MPTKATTPTAAATPRFVHYTLRARVPAQAAVPKQVIRGVTVPGSDATAEVPALVRPALVIGGSDKDGLDLFVFCHTDDCPGHAALTPRAVLKGDLESANTWH